MTEKKFYWLKLRRDFFKRHDIQIVEAMPNGKDYILFYLKLLCESIDHNGDLRFSDTIPYSLEMLSVVTNTNIDIVKRAVEIFSKLDMMEVLDDGTYFMTSVQGMIGSAVDSDAANRQRRSRERRKMLQEASVTKSHADVTEVVTEDHESKRKRKEIEKESETEKDFDRFWSAYPKKKNKGQARSAFFRALKKTSVETMISAVEKQKQSKDWKKDNGQFIPYPSTWLNAEAWENDEVIVTAPEKQERDVDAENLRKLCKKLGVPCKE